VAQRATANADERLLIVGHTDKVGPGDYNQSLSERRARSVFAYLNVENDQTNSEAEWKELRQRGTGLGNRRIKDTWGTRQYQYMLQALHFYPGNIDGDHGPLTDDAVKTFRAAKGLPVGTTVTDDVWEHLIRDYLTQTSHTVPDDRFLRNAKDACDGGTLKWLGCGEEDPLPQPQTPTELPHRQYRRTELLFVRATQLSCEVPQPDTFDLPSPGSVNSTWCLGPGNNSRHCCFATRNCPSASPGQWCITPGETGTVTVRGRILFEDGTAAANVQYLLIAPDGEFMDGEVVSGPRRGEGNFGRTLADGTFEYADPRGSGTYTMEVQGPFIARLDGAPQSEAIGSVVCKRMDGSSNFNVLIRSLNAVVSPIIDLASNVVVVKRSYTNPARQVVTLRTDGPFFRTGTFTVTGTAIKFFDAAVGGNEIAFNGTDNVFSGAALSAGVQIFAEGFTASSALNDVTLRLALTPGATPIGAATTATMTSVLLTMDIFMTRTVAGTDGASFPQPPDPAPAAGTGTDKWFGARIVHQQDPGNHHGRALIIVRPVQPAAFAGDLSLQNVTVAADTPGAADTRVQLFDNERPVAGEAAKANPHVFNASTIPATGLRLFAEGRNVSAALRDTGFQLGINGFEPDGDRVRLTVMRFSNLRAVIPSTPAQTSRLGNSPVPRHTLIRGGSAALVASDFDVDFAANQPLVLIENSVKADILTNMTNMSVVVTPAGVPVSWSLLRDNRPAPVGDHVSIAALSGSPTITPSAPGASTSTLLTDGVGSFHIRPFVDINGNNAFESNDSTIDIEPFMIMNLVLVRVTLFQDNCIAPVPTNVSGVSDGANGIAVSSGTFNIAAPNTAAVHLNSQVDLVGGGDDGLRGVDRVFAGWDNNIPVNLDIAGTFRDTSVAPPVNRREFWVFSSNRGTGGNLAHSTFLPGDPAPALVAPPLLDTGRTPGGVGGDSNCLGRSRIRTRTALRTPATPNAVGQRIIVEAVDSPGNGADANHPGFPAAQLVRFRFNLDFTAFLCFWTNITPSSAPTNVAAERLYTVLQEIDWQIRGEWTINPATGAVTIATAPFSRIPARVTSTPVSRGVDTTMEVRFPTALNLFHRDARS